MVLKMFKFIFFAFSIAFLSDYAYADYFVEYQITALDTTKGTLTLSDGSTWDIQPSSLPNVKSSWIQAGSVWIMPIYQAGTLGNGVAAVLFNFFSIPAMCSVNTGSTTLTLTAVDPTTGTATLSDGSSWTLDPHFQKYYSTWTVGDPMTIAGHNYLYYLIDGKNPPNNMSQTYSGASKS